MTVCVLEAGGRGDGTLVNVPTGAVAMMPTRINNWAFDTVPQPGLGGRIGYQPRGKVLGGSSAINAMVYIRGHRVDYDGWAALGNEGWRYDDVLPYFRLSEHNERFDDAWHGRDGPLWVSDLRTGNPFHARYLEAAQQAGLPLTDDFNGAQQEGIGIYQVTQKHGERWSAARAYLLPHVGRRDNLTVETHAQVLRILFDGTRAIGVEVRQRGEVRTLRARREVVLAAGALQTPQLLVSARAARSSNRASPCTPTCPASDATCRIIRISSSATARAASTRWACPRAAACACCASWCVFAANGAGC